jgi:methionine sulfoxide reductase heme-binding subunit
MTNRKIVALKVITWIACLEPAFLLLYKFLTHDMTANPIEFITLTTGTATLVLLLVTLAITPVRKFTGLNWLIRFRRLVGLFAFFYVCLHFATYLVLDIQFDWHQVSVDLTKRPFIIVGFTAFMLMIPLAVTSTAWAIRKMGGKKWNLLHKLIYVSAVLGIIHFWWKVKADHTEPATYGAILGVLLLARVFLWARSSKRPPSARPEPALAGD